MSFGELALKLGMLLVFFGVMIYVGFYCRKHSTDVNGFVLGGRNVGPWLTAFAYGTSYFSAVIFVGYAGQFGWKFGLAATWVGIGNALIGSLLAWVILGRRTRVMTQHLQSATMPDFFEKRFDAKSLKIAASIIIFIFMIPYTASLYNGLSRLFGMAFNIDYSVCVIAMAVLTAIYVIVGGYMATAVNDFIQGAVRRHRRDHRQRHDPRYLQFLLRPGSDQPLRRRDPDLPGHLGPAPDDRQVLCHQE